MGQAMTFGELAPGALVRKLDDQLAAALRPLMQRHPRYGLLDYPSHGNIGDSAIWLGEIALLHRLHGRGPDLANHMRFNPAEIGRYLPTDRLLYLHGGGNFGDVWDGHQAWREGVIARYRDHRIVQLPQSLHYRKPDGIEATRRAIGAHPDFHLMVRDRESEDFARRHFDCNVILAPDAAFCINMARFPRNPAPQGIGGLLRSDHEKRVDAGVGQQLLGPAAVDWQVQGTARLMAQKGLMGLFMVLPYPPFTWPRARAFDAMARARVAMGFAQLDQAEVVVADRLHAHIMSSLLGKPHVVIDNNYGKISRFIGAFGRDDVTLQARDYAEAVEMAETLIAQVRTAA